MAMHTTLNLTVADFEGFIRSEVADVWLAGMVTAAGTVSSVVSLLERLTASGWVGSPPDRVTVPSTGVYAISGGVRWATNNLGTRFMAICVNGADTGCTVDTDRPLAFAMPRELQ